MPSKSIRLRPAIGYGSDRSLVLCKMAWQFGQTGSTHARWGNRYQRNSRSMTGTSGRPSEPEAVRSWRG